MTEGPLLYTPDGTPIRLHLVGPEADMTYLGMVDEGVAGYETDHGEHVSVLFMAADDPQTTSEELVYGERGEFE